MPAELLREPDVIEESSFSEREFRQLWLIPLATYGVGDIVTTVTLLWFTDEVNELNAVVLFAVDAFGLAGFVGLKLVAFGACLGISLLGAHWEDAVVYYLPPATLSVVGVFVTAINLQLFFY
jgi:hypothetical protein